MGARLWHTQTTTTCTLLKPIVITWGISKRIFLLKDQHGFFTIDILSLTGIGEKLKPNKYTKTVKDQNKVTTHCKACYE